MYHILQDPYQKPFLLDLLSIEPPFPILNGLSVSKNIHADLKESERENYFNKTVELLNLYSKV